MTLYLERHANRLFPPASLEVASVLTVLLNDIVQSARLAAYLCVKGIPEQSLVVLRRAVEHLGVYTHVWREPAKYRFALDSESDEFVQAFRFPKDKTVTASLKAQNIRYRFMRCHAARPLSMVYELLSVHFVHGRPRGLESTPRLSCEFVDRAEPQALALEYKTVQGIMSLIAMELVTCIPQEDLLTEELAASSIAFSVFGPTLASVPGREDPEMTAAVDQLLNALANVRSHGSRE